MRFKTLACSLVMVGLLAATAKAGTMTTYLTVAGRFDNAVNYNPLPLVFAPDGAVANGQPGLFEVDISFTAVKDPGEKGWANTLFDLAAGLNAGGSNSALDYAIGYLPNSEVFGGVPFKPVYGTNLDAGIPNDLKAIVASIESATISDSSKEHRNQLGTPQAPAGAMQFPDPGSYIGSFWVDWNGLGRGTVVLTNQQYSFTIDTVPQSAGYFGPVQTGAGAMALFGVPEPATLTLLGLAGLGIIGFVHRRS